jgi:AbrB family looped-hinge helix DNA binding protein
VSAQPSNAERYTIRVGRRGTVVIPARLRQQYKLAEGSLVIAEAREEGILLRPAITLPIETYTPERKAEFLLSNAVDEEDCRRVADAVRAMGPNPEHIPHHKPAV